MFKRSVLGLAGASLLLGGFGCAPAPLPSSLSVSGIATHLIEVGDAPGVDAALHPLMLGVIAGPDLNRQPVGEGDFTEQYHDIGISSVRNNDYYDDRLDMEGIFNCGGSTYPSWEGCNATDDRFYDWTLSDAQYQSYLDGGFTPFLRLGGESHNENPPHDFKGPQNAVQEKNWIIAANKEVDRYEHWQGTPSAFTYLDIWTEFPHANFWDRSSDEFIAFWLKAYVDIKTKHPELKVGGPGMNTSTSLNVSRGRPGIAETFLKAAYAQKVHLDWLGWHVFSTDPAEYAKDAQAYRDLLNGTNMYSGEPWAGTGFFEQTELIADAYGLGDGSANTAQAGAILTAGWIALQYADLQGAYYYRGSDQSGQTSETTAKKKAASGEGGPGLFTGDGSYKPAAYGFRLRSEITTHYPHLLSTNIPADGRATDIWALAAMNNQGEIAVLVANPTTKATTISVTVAGKSLTEFGQATVYEVDDTSDGKEAALLATPTVSLPAGAVELIILKP